MKIVRISVLLLALVAAGSVLAGQTIGRDGAEKMAIDLDRETERLQLLQERYEKVQENIKQIIEIKRGGLVGGKKGDAALAHIPASVITENLRVERSITDKGLVYRITAKHVPVLQVFEAVAKTAGVRFEIHTGIGRKHLLGRIWLDLRDAEINEVLEIVAGTQSLGVSLDKDGILVAPETALSDRPLEQRLREMGIETYHRALVRFPASREAPWAYLGIARHYAATGFDGAAIETANRIVERYPLSPACPAAMLFLGHCHEKAGRFEDARKTYRLYLDSNPAAKDLALVTLRLGESWIREQKPSQGIPLFEEIVRHWPNSKETPMARMRLAECLVAQNQYERAVEQLKIVEAGQVKKGADNELAMVIARCLVKLKRYQAARIRLLGIVKHSESPKLAEQAYYGLGDIFLADGKPVAAIEVYTGAMRGFPDGVRRATAPLNICKAYAQMGAFAKVEAILSNLPDSAWATDDIRGTIMALAEYYLSLRRHADVLQLMADRRWPHDSATDAEIQLLISRTLLAKSTPLKALAHAKRAVSLARDDALRARAVHAVGNCLQLLERPVLAGMAYAGEIK